MTPTETRAVIRMAVQACMAADAAAFASLFATDGQLVLPGQTLTGRAAIQATTTAYLATLTAIEIELVQMIVEGDHAAIAWIWQATQTATGDRQQSENAILLAFRRGFITSWREYSAVTVTVSPPS
ncbi:MAG: nuclear transport factor 2 family protein [Spirulinaceae cyanobacterium RM2_2_10]|nr:nuclear transport factor 2 family protein [Spirulinaceae cyanobacterium SM2_1_0]NJO20545.1 nuclear transport factor 2 family protein [Spirulinaceae cyanobacterium RM2_2_10]